MLLLQQYFTICVYLLFMGFCFCDGFKLHVLKKLLWFSVFAAVAVDNLKTTGMFQLEAIVPLPTLLAFLLCWHQKQCGKNAQKN